MQSFFTNRKPLLFITLASLFLISLLFTFLFFLLFIFTDFSSSPSSFNRKTFDYQITEITPSQHTPKPPNFQIAQIHRELEPNEYLSYYNEETHSTFYLSHFGGSKYECTGTCSCRDSDERRVASPTTSILTRSLMVLLTAFSSTMALQLAKESFHNECVTQFSDLCGTDDPSAILSEVDECEELKIWCPEETAEEEEGKEKLVYQCKGHCVENDAFHHDLGSEFTQLHTLTKKIYKIGRKNIGNCQKMTLEKEVIISMEDPADFKQWDDDGTSLIYDEMYEELQGTTKEDYNQMKAESVFATFPLSKFCESTTRLKHKWFSDDQLQMLAKAKELIREKFNELYPNVPDVYDDLQNTGKVSKKGGGWFSKKKKKIPEEEEQVIWEPDLEEKLKGFSFERPFCVGILLGLNVEFGDPRMTEFKNVNCVQVKK